MKTLDILNELNSKIPLTDLCKMGVLSPRIYCYREIFMKYDALIKSGEKSMSAKRTLSDEMNVTVRTIENAIKYMRS